MEVAVPHKSQAIPAYRYLCRMILGLAGCVAIVVVFSYPWWMPNLYNFLDVSHQPQQSDIIVILGGGGLERPQLGADLYLQGFAQRVVVSGLKESMDYAIKTLVDRGIPEQAIIINDRATSTYTEAQQVLAILIAQNANSALIVTDQFHTRRAAATYNHVFASQNIQITFVSSEDHINGSDWWVSKNGARVWEEYIKMLYYWFAYGIFSG